MVLQKAIIDIPLGGGIDEGTHDHLVQAPKLARLSNMRFDKTGGILSRPGYEDVCASDATTTPHRVEHLANLRDGVLLAFCTDGVRVLTDDESGATWASRDVRGPRAIDIRTSRIGIGNSRAVVVKSASNGTTRCHVWSDAEDDGGDGKIYVTVTDADTDVALLEPVVISGMSAAGYSDVVKNVQDCALYVVPCGPSSYVVTCADDTKIGTVYYAVIAVSGTTVTVGSTTQFVDTTWSLALSRSAFRIAGTKTTAQVYTYSGGSAGYHYLRRWTLSGTVLTFESVSRWSSSQYVRALHINEQSGRVFALSADTATIDGVQSTLSATLPSSLSPATVVTFASGSRHPQRMHLATMNASGDMMLAWDQYEKNSAGASTMTVFSTIVDEDLALYYTARRINNAVIYAHAIEDIETQAVAIVVAPCIGVAGTIANGYQPWSVTSVGGARNDDNAQRRMAFIIEARAGLSSVDLRVTGMLHVGIAKLPVTADEVSQEIYDESSMSADGALSSVTTLHPMHSRIGMNTKPAVTTPHSGSSVSALGLVAYSDSSMCREATATPPDIRSAGGTGDPTFSYTSYMGGTRDISACWVRRDENGVIYRSAPAPILTETARDYFGTYLFNLEIVVSAPLCESFWDDDDDLFLEIYSTTGDTSDGVLKLANVKVKGSSGYVDKKITDIGYRWSDLVDSDAPWQSKPLAIYTYGDRELYTNGGVLAADPPPSPAHMAATRDRIWVIDAENRRRVVYTKPIGTSHGPQFSDFLTIETPTDDELVALGASGDTLFLLTSNSTWALEAIGGPDSTGRGSWPPLRRISSTVGCVNAASVVAVDGGIMTQGRDGVYIISEAGEVRRVGRDIEDVIKRVTIRSAVHAPSTRIVHLDGVDTNGHGVSMVYDMEHGQWSMYDHGQGVDIYASAHLGGRHVYADSGAVLAESRTSAPEAVQPSSMQTGWIKVASMQGVQRVWRVGVLGRLRYTDPGGEIHLGTVTMTVAYDYDETSSDTYTIDLDGVKQYDPLHLRVHLARQKCTSLKVGITYQPPTGTPPSGTNVAAALELSSIALEFGMKRGIRKIALAGGGSVT